MPATLYILSDGGFAAACRISELGNLKPIYVKIAGEEQAQRRHRRLQHRSESRKSPAAFRRLPGWRTMVLPRSDRRSLAVPQRHAARCQEGRRCRPRDDENKLPGPQRRELRDAGDRKRHPQAANRREGPPARRQHGLCRRQPAAAGEGAGGHAGQRRPGAGPADRRGAEDRRRLDRRAASCWTARPIRTRPPKARTT